jgi:hypothetical protein
MGRKQTIGFVYLQLKREHEAAIDFRNANSALMFYNEMHPTNKVVLRNKPELKDFYTPSQEI